MQAQTPDMQSLKALLSLDKREFLSQAYLLLLGRRIDPDGMKSHLDLLDRGTSKAAILYAIQVSREGVARSGPFHGQIARHLIELALQTSPSADEVAVSLPTLLRQDAVDFAKTAFDLVARRPPYTDELEFYVNEVTRGAPNLGVLEDIVRAVKAKDATAPGALAMEAAILDWRAGLYPTAKSLQQLLKFEDVQFIDCVYKTFLKRPPDITGLSSYIRRYRSGVPKMEIVTSIAESPEGRRQGVKLPGYRRSALHRCLSQLWIFSRSEHDPSQIESGRRQLRALYRATQRVLQAQEDDTALRDQLVQRVDALFRNLS
jgi:hypothetical protein